MHIVERIEGESVVLELPDGTMKVFPLRNFDFEINAGDVLSFSGGKFVLNTAKTNERKKKLSEKQSRLFGD